MRQEVLTIKGVNANQVIEKFCYFFQPNAKLVIAKGNVHVYIIERYYFRISADVVATILFELRNENLLDVHIVIAGGSDMMGFTLGAHNSFLKKIRTFFAKLRD